MSRGKKIGRALKLVLIPFNRVKVSMENMKTFHIRSGKSLNPLQSGQGFYSCCGEKYPLNDAHSLNPLQSGQGFYYFETEIEARMFALS